MRCHVPSNSLLVRHHHSSHLLVVFLTIPQDPVQKREGFGCRRRKPAHFESDDEHFKSNSECHARSPALQPRSCALFSPFSRYGKRSIQLGPHPPKGNRTIGFTWEVLSSLHIIDNDRRRGIGVRWCRRALG